MVADLQKEKNLIRFDTSGTEYDLLLDQISALASRSIYDDSALKATTDLLAFNCSHYSVWIFRRRILSSFSQKDQNIWEKELEWLDSIIIQETKNYQIWQHRQIIISNMKIIPVIKEMTFLDSFILSGPNGDPKNYHAWAYRIWLVNISECYFTELTASEYWIKKDPWNNSAWNYRAFLMQVLAKNNTELIDLDQEKRFISTFLDKGNQSIRAYQDFLSVL